MINLNTKQLVGWVLVLGAVNWGLVGILKINLVETLFGAASTLSTVVYGLIGVAGIYKAYVMLSKSK